MILGNPYRSAEGEIAIPPDIDGLNGKYTLLTLLGKPIMEFTPLIYGFRAEWQVSDRVESSDRLTL